MGPGKCKACLCEWDKIPSVRRGAFACRIHSKFEANPTILPPTPPRQTSNPCNPFCHATLKYTSRSFFLSTTTPASCHTLVAASARCTEVLMLVLKFGLVGRGGAYIHARRRARSGPTLLSISHSTRPCSISRSSNLQWISITSHQRSI